MLLAYLPTDRNETKRNTASPSSTTSSGSAYALPMSLAQTGDPWGKETKRYAYIARSCHEQAGLEVGFAKRAVDTAVASTEVVEGLAHSHRELPALRSLPVKKSLFPPLSLFLLPFSFLFFSLLFFSFALCLVPREIRDLYLI